jgi:PAS domain S-box-containing protein
MARKQSSLFSRLKRLLMSNSVGSDVARRFIPAAIVLPLGLGWLIFQGQQANWYDSTFALSLLALSFATTWIILICRSAQILNQLDDDRKLSQQNDQFLNGLDLRLRQLPDAAAMTWEALQSLGQFLPVDRVVWNEIDWETRTTTIEHEWRRSEDIPDITGVYPLEDYFTPEQLEYFTRGQTLIVDDVMIHPATEPYAQGYLRLGIRSFVIVPLVYAGCWVAILSISTKTARKWRPNEVTLLQDIVARLWSMIDYTKAMQALSEEEVWTDRCKALFGFSPATKMTYEVFLNTLHPEDRERTHAAVMRALEEKSEYNIEYRSCWPDGSIHWIAAKGRGFYDATGNPVQMLGTAQEISERKHAEFVLAEQTKALLEANRLKDEFLAALSHELRTPLNPILGWTRMLQAQALSPSETATALATIDRNVKQQIALVSDLLDVSQVIQGKLKLNLRSLDLADVIRSAIDTVQFAALAKEITLQFLGLSSLKTVGDNDRLQQVVWNLLSNAIKFTPRGGRVEIDLSIGATQMAEVRINDTGIGITPEFLPYVFDHFRQADGSTSRKYGGLGLGLSIVRHLVGLHGGTVLVESEPGAGATFTVKLPLSLQVSPQSAEAEHPVEAHLTAEHESFNHSLSKFRILIVDDDLDNLDLIRFLLQRDGAAVMTFTTASQALESLPQVQPDLIISDIGMPEMNGYEFMQRARALPQAHNIPAIALTAFAQPTDKVAATQAGFQFYFAKPVDPNQLLATVTQLLAG